MDEDGKGLSAVEPRFSPSGGGRHRAPVRLGLTLRSVLLTPSDGFAAAIRAGERRARAGERLAEGSAPYVLCACGGVGAMSLWLKLSALVGWRSASVAEIDVALLSAALVLGAVLGLAGQLLWGVVGRDVVTRLGGEARARDLRLVWGASCLPQVGAVVVLLPADLAIVGPASFTSDALGDPVATAWAALSIAGQLGLAVWSLWIFWRGVEVASGLRWRRALPAALTAALCIVALVGGLAVAGGTFVSA